MAKSTWMGVNVRTANDRENVLSWFGAMGEGVEITEAHILCDNATDREKKVRVRGVDGDQRIELTRTLGGKTFSIKRVVLP